MRESDCQQQIADIHGILQKYKATETTVGCSHRSYGLETFVHLDAIWNHFHLLDMYTASDTYNYFAECNRDKARAIEQKRREGYDVQYGICRYDSYARNEEEALYYLDLY
jgi:hypothetical protein